MKKILLYVFAAFSLHANAQFVLEHTYDSAATWNTCSGNSNQLLLVDFEVSGERYVRINRCGNQLNIYDLNHTLVNTVSLAGLPHNSPNVVGTILYLSENLFDMDAGMEFMYISDSGGFYTTKIYDANGPLLFSQNGAPFVITNIHLQQYPIYNTSAGTKLILSYANGQAKVFSLPGTLSTAIETFNENLLSSSDMISNPYPNPTTGSARIAYTFPEGINNGEIVFYDLSGNEVKRFRVDSSFDHLLISTSDISAGTYYYQLQTSAQNSEGRKLIVIE